MIFNNVLRKQPWIIRMQIFVRRDDHFAIKIVFSI